MLEKLVEALTTKPLSESGPMEMLNTHCVRMEQGYRHQGKANVPISGFTWERQTLSVTHSAALTFEPDMAEAGVILQAQTTGMVLTNQNGHPL